MWRIFPSTTVSPASSFVRGLEGVFEEGREVRGLAWLERAAPRQLAADARAAARVHLEGLDAVEPLHRHPAVLGLVVEVLAQYRGAYPHEGVQRLGRGVGARAERDAALEHRLPRVAPARAVRVEARHDYRPVTPARAVRVKARHDYRPVRRGEGGLYVRHDAELRHAREKVLRAYLAVDYPVA